MTLKGKRDRAILATIFYHGLRCDELCRLKAGDRQTRQGVPHLRIHGKGDKIRFIPTSGHAIRLIDDYLLADGRTEDRTGALFRPSETTPPAPSTNHCIPGRSGR